MSINSTVQPTPYKSHRVKYGSQATVTAAEALVLREAFLGLHYVWRMR